MLFDLYVNEDDPKFILCVKCGRYIKINRDCECDLLYNIRRKDNSGVPKNYTKGIPKLEARFIS